MKLTNPKATFTDEGIKTMMSLEFDKEYDNGNIEHLTIPYICFDKLEIETEIETVDMCDLNRSGFLTRKEMKKRHNLIIPLSQGNNHNIAFIVQTTKAMTMADIEKALGYKVKIVD